MGQGNTEKAVPDRKLGDEWNDWKGDGDPAESVIDEKASTFLSLAGGVVFVFISLLLIGWFMVKPRFDQIDPSVAQLGGLVVMVFIAGFVIAVFFEGTFLLKRGKSLFPPVWVEKLLLSLLPRAIWLGGRFGISKDRVGNSFIKLHNFITRSRIGKRGGGRFLVLLPRCLRKEARARLTNRLNGDNFKIYTAAGGEEARKAIREYRPSTILAIACERDLMSGIKDVADKIPVLAIPNKRPEGPCKNTDFSESELEEALGVLTGKSIRN